MLKKRPTNYTLLGVGERATDGAGGRHSTFCGCNSLRGTQAEFLDVGSVAACVDAFLVSCALL